MQKDEFNTKIGAIAAAAGSAVGLGNIWRFPYVLGENGGAAFLLVYIGFTLLIAMPVLLTELSIGRMAGTSVIAAYKKLAPRRKWYLIGVGGVICAFFILSFYNIVSGWTLLYAYKSLVGDLQGLSEAEITASFEATSGNTLVCFGWMLAVIAITVFIIAHGVKKGIERYSIVLMPLLLVLIIVICVFSLSLDGAERGLEFMLRPDFSKLTPKAVFAALGQSFFSMSIGMGCMTTYGAYIKKKQNLSKSAISVALIDFFVSFTAGLMIFPCAFAFGINPGSGPGLVFVTLPNIFNQMVMGRVFSILFFALLVIAALTSSISLYEVLTSFFKDHFSISRKRASVFVALATIVTGALCAFSATAFNFFDNFTANVLMPLGALFILLFVPCCLGKEKIRAELEAHGKPMRWFGLYYFLVKFIIPALILLIFVNSIMSWLGINWL